MADNTPVVNPKIGVNIGSGTALGGLAAAWVTFLTAAVSAGSDFYTDNGVAPRICIRISRRLTPRMRSWAIQGRRCRARKWMTL